MFHRLLKIRLSVLVLLTIPVSTLPCCSWACCSCSSGSIEASQARITTVRPTVYPPSNVEYCDPEQEPRFTEASNEFQGQRSGIGSFIKDQFNKLKSGKSNTSTTKKPTKPPTVHTTTKPSRIPVSVLNKKHTTTKPSRIPVSVTTEKHTTTKPSRVPVSVTTEKHHTVKPTHHDSHPDDVTEKPEKRRRKKILKIGSAAWKAAQLALEGVQMAVQAAELKDQVVERLKWTTTTTTPKPEYEYYYEGEGEAGETNPIRPVTSTVPPKEF